MIILTAALKAKKGKEADVEKILVHMVSETAQEEGALEYRLHKSTTKPGSFYLYEKYTGQAAIDAHVETDHYKALGASLNGLVEGDLEIELYNFIDGIPENK
ncbi:putative quinol monooxygenase [Maridesulfovibrio frigidus]|uniref:putative quinol monooxygenase n=1 Tax=Maridesulfovibrio frigidus TaxID=340956 RepID=UPI0004E17C93|nr:putative quinol monooxygenase [Maridesulfovibrio frigidus]